MDSYYLIINIGSILGAVFLLSLYWKKSRSWKKAIVVLLISFVVIEAGDIGGRLVRVLSYGDGLNIWELFTKEQGTHFIGRVIFAVLFFPWAYRLVYRHTKREWMEYLDLLCIFMTFQHIFNRIACLSYGCCMGKSYNGFLAFRYPAGSGTGAGYTYPVYPTQLFEIACMVLLLVLLLVLHRRKQRLLYVFCGVFSITIFLSEFMMDTRGTILIQGFSVIQYAAVLLAGIAGIYLIAVRKGKHCPFEQ